MRAQPTGTVTLLFGDIEGSTRLLHVLGADRYARVLERHRFILRDAFDQYGGYEVDCEGDAFFVAFASAADAVAAASEGQLALAAEAWPGGVELRVRIGALRLGRVELAADLLRDVIHLEVEMPSTSGLLETFTVAAAIAAAMNRPKPAARLLGAAHRIADETGYRQHMIDAEQAEATLQQVRAALGGQADTAFAAGRAMTLDEAVADALDSIS